MKNVYAISDLHLNPGDRFPDYSGLGGMLVVVGDLLNILPWGMNRWRIKEGYETCKSVADGLPEAHCVLMGNHEGRFSWLRELLAESFGVSIARQLDIVPYHFEHGHKFTEWRILRHIADDAVEWLTSNSFTRKLWYDFCIRQGWMPSCYANPGTKYEKMVGAYWALVLAQAHKEHWNYVIGHSHTSCNIGPTEFGVQVIDLGNNDLVRII